MMEMLNHTKLCVFFLFAISHIQGSSLTSNLQLHVEGNGFHRNLTYYIESDFEMANCDLMLNLELPTSLYVNTDELDFLRRNQMANIYAIGSNDVESFTEKVSNPQIVRICSNHSRKLHMSIPLHQRYKYASLKGGYEYVVVAEPTLLLGCEHKIENVDIVENELHTPCSTHVKYWHNLTYNFANQSYTWKIPVGSKTYLNLVTVVTLLTSIIGSTLVFKIIRGINVSLKKMD